MVQADGPLEAAFKAMQALLQHSNATAATSTDSEDSDGSNAGSKALLACVRLLTSSELSQVPIDVCRQSQWTCHIACLGNAYMEKQHLTLSFWLSVYQSLVSCQCIKPHCRSQVLLGTKHTQLHA